MDKNSTNEASLLDAGVNKSERAPKNTKVMQNKSSGYNFVSLSIKKASNKIDGNNLMVLNSYARSCKSYNNFHVYISSHTQKCKYSVFVSISQNLVLTVLKTVIEN